MSKAKLRAAQELLREKRYHEAQALLRTVDHPTAKQWLKQIDKRVGTQKKTGTAKYGEERLYHASPSMLRAAPISFILVVALSFILVGLPILLLWWVSTKNTVLTITDENVTLRKGILSKHINEISLANVRNVKISQGPVQRMTGAGRIEISTASGFTDDIVVNGLPHPDKIRAIINSARR